MRGDVCKQALAKHRALNISTWVQPVLTSLYVDIEPFAIVSKKFYKNMQQLADSCLKWLAVAPNHHCESLGRTLHELCAPVKNALVVVVHTLGSWTWYSQQRVQHILNIFLGSSGHAPNLRLMLWCHQVSVLCYEDLQQIHTLEAFDRTPKPPPGKVYVHREMQKIMCVFFVCVDVCADVWENIAIV